MFARFFRLGLRPKILAIGIVGVAGVLAAGGIYFASVAMLAEYERIAETATDINQRTYKLAALLRDTRHAEKDFLLGNDEKDVTRHAALSKSVGAGLIDIKQRSMAAGHGAIAQRIDAIAAGFARYEQDFSKLVEAKRTLGLDPESGLEGTLRQAVRGIETELGAYKEPDLTILLLTMQRHEKDFMLRRDAKYVDAVTQALSDFNARIDTSALPDSAKRDIATKRSAYQRAFRSWAARSDIVAGARKTMSDAFTAMEPEFDAALAEIESVNGAAQHAKEEVRDRTKSGMIVAVGVLALTTLALAFLIGRSVVNPLIAMTAAMRQLAGGDLQIAIPGAGRKDEIGGMSAAVEVFRKNGIEVERTRAERIEQRKQAEADRKIEMGRLADSFQAAVGNIVNTVSSASSELEASAGTLTRSAENTQRLAGIVASASEESSTNVRSVAASTDEMTASVNEISQQVQTSSRIAGEAVEQAEKTDARINQLSQAASRIGDVVKLITAIAEQTNLLALNATIEAARAGEAGRGFAIVASEVKALASQTAKATEEIGAQIASMQAATQDSVGAIKEIGGTIGRISEIASAIAAAVEEQGATTQEISRNVSQAAKGTAEVASNITDVNRGAIETGSASARVLSSAQSLSSESHYLKIEVDKFLTTVRAA